MDCNNDVCDNIRLREAFFARVDRVPFDLTEELSKVIVPVLVIHKDEDHGALGTGAFPRRTIPSAGLAVLPKTGHTTNLEEPALCNYFLQEFLSTVESGRYTLNNKKDLRLSYSKKKRR